jgi:hypothetical protein
VLLDVRDGVVVLAGSVDSTAVLVPGLMHAVPGVATAKGELVGEVRIPAAD